MQHVINQLTDIIIKEININNIPIGCSFILTPEGCRVIQSHYLDGDIIRELPEEQKYVRYDNYSQEINH